MKSIIRKPLKILGTLDGLIHVEVVLENIGRSKHGTRKVEKLVDGKKVLIDEEIIIPIKETRATSSELYKLASEGVTEHYGQNLVSFSQRGHTINMTESDQGNNFTASIEYLVKLKS